MSSDVTAFIGRLGLEGAILFGYSDGGIVGLLTAIRAPGTLSGLICAGANTEPSMLDPEVYRECEEWNREHDDPRMTMMLSEPHITVEELETIHIPTYVVAGSDDCILREDTDRIAGAIGCSMLRIMNGHDHSSYIEDHTILPGLIRDGVSFITANR
jgi:pimeloyl-ACP methyl ester carboxylesterase